MGDRMGDRTDDRMDDRMDEISLPRPVQNAIAQTIKTLGGDDSTEPVYVAGNDSPPQEFVESVLGVAVACMQWLNRRCRGPRGAMKAFRASPFREFADKHCYRHAAWLCRRANPLDLPPPPTYLVWKTNAHKHCFEVWTEKKLCRFSWSDIGTETAAWLRFCDLVPEDSTITKDLCSLKSVFVTVCRLLNLPDGHVAMLYPPDPLFGWYFEVFDTYGGVHFSFCTCLSKECAMCSVY